MMDDAAKTRSKSEPQPVVNPLIPELRALRADVSGLRDVVTGLREDMRKRDVFYLPRFIMWLVVLFVLFPLLLVVVL